MSLHKTRGIVLHKVNYSESSVILKVYTELFGIQSYLVKGVRKKKPLISPALLQHLSLLELVVYHKELGNLQHIKEIHAAFPFTHIPFDIRKSSLAIFLNEVIYKALKEEETNAELFNFLFDSIVRLDEATAHLNTFHLCFCVQYSKYLGFYPSGNWDLQHPYFDLVEGVYVNTPPLHQYYLTKEISQILFQYSSASWENMSEISINNQQRKNLLMGLMDYYRIHLQGFGNIQSHHILEQVLG